jgi:hypothetical protein
VLVERHEGRPSRPITIFVMAGLTLTRLSATTAFPGTPMSEPASGAITPLEDKPVSPLRSRVARSSKAPRHAGAEVRLRLTARRAAA